MSWRALSKGSWRNAILFRLQLTSLPVSGGAFRIDRKLSTVRIDDELMEDFPDHAVALTDSLPAEYNAYEATLGCSSVGNKFDLPSDESLVKLVENRNYAAAARMRVHLDSLHTEIRPHFIYESMALHILSLPIPGGQYDKRVAEFASWLSLIPFAHESEKPTEFLDIRKMLFQTGYPATNVFCIMQFALICALKGYAHVVMAETVNLLTRVLDPDIGKRFFHQFEGVARKYFQTYLPQDFKKKESLELRGLAVRICTEAGWLPQAVQLLRASHEEQTLSPSTATYTFLLEKLKENSDLGNVHIVENLLRNRKSSQAQNWESQIPRPGSSPTIITRVYDKSSPIPSTTISQEETTRLNRSLLDLINADMYFQADDLFIYMIRNSIPVRAKPIYEKAVVAMLHRRPRLRRDAQTKFIMPSDAAPPFNLERAMEWFHYLPNRHMLKSPINLHGVRELLFRSGPPKTQRDGDRTSQFAVLFTVKGYGDLVWEDYVSFAKHIPFNLALPTFLRLQKEALKYLAAHGSHTEGWSVTYLRWAVVHACCALGWVDMAASLIDQARVEGLDPPHTILERISSLREPNVDLTSRHILGPVYSKLAGKESARRSVSTMHCRKMSTRAVNVEAGTPAVSKSKAGSSLANEVVEALENDTIGVNRSTYNSSLPEIPSGSNKHIWRVVLLC